MAKRPTLVHARPGTLAHLIVGGVDTVVRIPVQIVSIHITTYGTLLATFKVTAERGTYHVKGETYMTLFSNIESRTPTRTTLIPVWREED